METTAQYVASVVIRFNYQAHNASLYQISTHSAKYAAELQRFTADTLRHAVTLTSDPLTVNVSAVT